MKKTLLLFTLLCLFQTMKSQDDLSARFNSTASGRNISICYSKLIKDKNEIGGGMRININSITQHDDQSNIYHKRLYASNFLQHFGLQLFYHRYFFEKWTVKPFVFYDYQMAYSTTRTSMYIPHTYDINGDILYKNFIEYFGPFLWIEQSVGVGFKVKVFGSFYLVQQFGLTVMFILGEEDQLPQREFEFPLEFGQIISVGIAYRLNE